MSRTGRQCSIFELIDGLDESRDVKELAAKLKPILDQLAYGNIAGDSVEQAHEEWHDNYTDVLYAEASSDFKAASAGARPQRSDTPKRSAKPRGASSSATFRETKPTGGLVPRQPPARPARSHVPASLRAIMDGTHPTLRDDDD